MNLLPIIIRRETIKRSETGYDRSGDDGGYDWTCRASSAFGRIVKLLPSTGSVNGGCFRRQIGELNTLLAPAPTERAEFTLCGPASRLVVPNGHAFVCEYFRKVDSYLSFPLMPIIVG